MKAMTITHFGGTEGFKMAEIEKPELQAGRVLIRVMASSVNPSGLQNSWVR